MKETDEMKYIRELDQQHNIKTVNHLTHYNYRYADIPEEIKEKLRPLARERAKIWYQENKEEKKQYLRERYHELIECPECGITIKRGQKSKHNKSKEHLINCQ